MKPYLLLLLFLLAIVPSLGDAPRVRDDSSIVRGDDFASLTRAEALEVEGKRALFGVVLDCPEPESETEESDYRGRNCRSGDGTERTLMLRNGQKLRTKMVVEATLCIIDLPPWADIQDGTWHEGFTRYLLMDAKRIK